MSIPTKKLFVFCILLFIIINGNIGQNNISRSINLESMDVYLLKFKLINEISEIKYSNCVTGKSFVTTLYRIKIDEIIHSSDTSVYNHSDLSKIKYALFQKKPAEDQLIGAFYNSEDQECLIFNRSLPNDITSEAIFFQHSSVIWISPCNHNKRVITNSIKSFEQEFQR
jgi:hypothetical protein